MSEEISAQMEFRTTFETGTHDWRLICTTMIWVMRSFFTKTRSSQIKIHLWICLFQIKIILLLVFQLQLIDRKSYQQSSRSNARPSNSFTQKCVRKILVIMQIIDWCLDKFYFTLVSCCFIHIVLNINYC